MRDKESLMFSDSTIFNTVGPCQLKLKDNGESPRQLVMAVSLVWSTVALLDGS
jgi:hypothetical protein